MTSCRRDCMEVAEDVKLTAVLFFKFPWEISKLTGPCTGDEDILPSASMFYHVEASVVHMYYGPRNDV